MPREKVETTDYQTFTTKNMPREARSKLNVGDIWSNAIRCRNCGDVIRSKNRHDLVYCLCEKVFVDGGSWYVRCGGQLNMIEYLTEYYDDVFQRVR